MDNVKTEADESQPGPSGLSVKKDESKSSSESYSEDSDSGETVIEDKLSENYAVELEDDLNKPKTTRAKKKRSTKMPPHLKGLMGEANLRFARGEYDMCEKMCLEIVRQVPLAYEPYVTLSQIYETRHVGKSMQYLTIASHLKPYDFEQWCRLAQLQIDCNNKREAITCYTRALQALPQDYEIQIKRIQLLEEISDAKYALKCKVRLLHTMGPLQVPEMLKLSKELAEKFHADEDYVKAIEVMSVPFNKIPDKITPEYVNIMLELLLLHKDYPACLDIFVQFCNIDIEIFLEEGNRINILNYSIPVGIQIDLKIKFIICLIKLETFGLLPQLLQPLLVEEDVEQIGDLFLDVAEALMSVNKPEEALKLLVPLIKSHNFFLAAVWLKHAECLNACEMHEQAIDSYMTVVRMAPQHMEVRHPLSDLLLKYERKAEALVVLTPDMSSGDLDVALLVKRIELLHSMDDFEEYCKAMDLLYSRHCTQIRRYDEIQALIYLDRFYDKMTRIRKMRELRGETISDTQYNCTREPPVEEEMDLLRSCLRYCFEKKRFDQMQKYAFQSLIVYRFKHYTDELYIYCFYSAMYNNDVYHAFRVIRELVTRYPKGIYVWNLFNMCSPKIDKLTKFLIRLGGKNVDSTILKILEANNALMSCNLKMAVMHIMPLFKDDPCPPPFICLFLGVVLAQMSKQRTTSKKLKLTQTVYALFLSYVNNRGKEARHEVYYNLGRLYQYFGISHIAAHYYNKVLQYKSPLIEKYPVLDLKRETAYNLFLLYKECENYTLAKDILVKYLTF